MRFKAIIFDMDGVLLDSERIALETFSQACETFQVTVDPSLYLSCVGTNNEKTKECRCITPTVFENRTCCHSGGGNSHNLELLLRK